MAKKSQDPREPESSRIPDAVGSLPFVGGLVRGADTQARWMADLLEQNARLIGQLPATIKSFNDALERLNQTLNRLDKTVTRLERTSRTVTGPIDRAAALLDPKALAELPGALDSLRRTVSTETLPALRAAGDAQSQITLLQTSVENLLAALADLPGVSIVRRLTGRDVAVAAEVEPARSRRPEPR